MFCVILRIRFFLIFSAIKSKRNKIRFLHIKFPFQSDNLINLLLIFDFSKFLREILVFAVNHVKYAKFQFKTEKNQIDEIHHSFESHF